MAKMVPKIVKRAGTLIRHLRVKPNKKKLELDESKKSFKNEQTIEPNVNDKSTNRLVFPHSTLFAALFLPCMLSIHL